MGTEEPHSLECIHKSELFPKKTIVVEDDSLQVPFPTINGEYVSFLGRTSDGVIALSNFRVFVRKKKSFVNVPLGLIESVDTREIFYLAVYCKDATTIRCAFSTNEQCQQWYKRLVDAISSPKEFGDLFALAYHAWQDEGEDPASSWNEDGYTFGKDIQRMQFDTSKRKAWKISLVNEAFSLTPSYPRYHIVPGEISDDDLQSVASFRALKRFPSVVWRDQRNGAVLVRCSQPELGWLGWRNEKDENLLSAIPKACANNPGSDVGKKGASDGSVADDVQTTVMPKKMLLIDCRSYGAAFANRAKGGGCESADYYPNCEIQFMNLANIHTVRKSFIALRTLCSSHTDPSSWLSSLENTRWLQHMSSLLRAATLVVSTIDKEARPVLVHCSDGWDRTSQIITIAELLLDPYYRTVKGFHALIERDWLDFGHKFADRCGHSTVSDDTNERSPIFVQWLDCIFQIFRKYPCAFEFNEAFLVKIVQHTYSRLFGTFLCNSVLERQDNQISERTESVWSLLLNNDKFLNRLYNPTTDPHVLNADYGMHQLELWKSIYQSKNSLDTNPDLIDDCMKVSDLDGESPDAELTGSGLQKTRSCESLNKVGVELAVIVERRRSDPNILHNVQEAALLLAKEVDSSQCTTSITTSECDCDKSDALDVVVQNGLSNGDMYCDHNGGDMSDSDIERCAEEEDELGGGAVGVVPVVNGHSDVGTNGDLVNGDRDDVSPCLLSSSSQIDILARKLSQRNLLSVNSSTDTITETSDDCEHRFVSNGVSDGPLSNGGHHGAELTNGLTAYSVFRNVSTSTSTTDISDSSVCLHGAYGEKRDFRHSLHFIPMRLNCGAPASAASCPVNSPSTSPYPTPVNSRTPSSTCPPTPGTAEGKMTESPLTRHLNYLGRHLDEDGLTTFVDPVQHRMIQLENEYRRRFQILELQLAANRRILQQNGWCNGRTFYDYRDDIASLPESAENGDFSSLGNISNPASDVSFEQVDELKMTLWVPDHAVTHCAGCYNAFSLVRRKHHCRSCGRVYCNTCSNYSSPVPDQHLEECVRVCRSCHLMLQPIVAAAPHHHHPLMSEDRRIPILVPE